MRLLLETSEKFSQLYNLFNNTQQQIPFPEKCWLDELSGIHPQISRPRIILFRSAGCPISKCFYVSNKKAHLVWFLDNFPSVLKSKRHPVITVVYFLLRKLVPSLILGVSEQYEARDLPSCKPVFRFETPNAYFQSWFAKSAMKMSARIHLLRWTCDYVT